MRTGLTTHRRASTDRALSLGIGADETEPRRKTSAIERWRLEQGGDSPPLPVSCMLSPVTYADVQAKAAECGLTLAACVAGLVEVALGRADALGKDRARNDAGTLAPTLYKSKGVAVTVRGDIERTVRRARADEAAAEAAEAAMRTALGI